jgi:hypothetical protein
MVPLNLTITFENMLPENVKKQTWISSQKGMGWLSKNFDIQGAVFFLRVRQYMWYAPRVKMRYDTADRTFCLAIRP